MAFLVSELFSNWKKIYKK